MLARQFTDPGRIMRHLPLAALAALALGLPAAAQPSLVPQLSNCLAIPGVLQRLACYDALAHAAGATAPTRPRVPQYVPPPPLAAAPVAPAPTSSFGSEQLPRTPAQSVARPQKLLAGVTDLRFDPYGRFTITLDNGQVWRQAPGDTTLMRHERVTQVEISRGAMGSYVLQAVGRNASYTVARIR